MSSTSNWSVTEAPRDAAAALELETGLIFPHFTSSDAVAIGLLLHAHLSEAAPKPCLISISLGSSTTPAHVVFQCATREGTTPDNQVWVARKRATVCRWGVSSWVMRTRFGFGAEAETDFAAKFGLGSEARQYAIHGGGVPVRVKGVEGLAGVIIVSGLKQEEDHMVVIEAVKEYLEGLSGEEDEE